MSSVACGSERQELRMESMSMYLRDLRNISVPRRLGTAFRMKSILSQPVISDDAKSAHGWLLDELRSGSSQTIHDRRASASFANAFNYDHAGARLIEFTKRRVNRMRVRFRIASQNDCLEVLMINRDRRVPDETGHALLCM